jgi:plastocyanin
MESGNAVVITGYAFNPADITVNAGTTVRWTNEEQGVERLQINNGLKSQVLTTGESWTQIFNQAGVYNYSSMIHPSMQGSVTVV